MNSNVTTTDNNNGDEHEKRTLRNSNTGDRGFNDNFGFGRFVMEEFIVLALPEHGGRVVHSTDSLKDAVDAAKDIAKSHDCDAVIYKAFRVARPVTKVQVDEFKPLPQPE